MDISEVGLAVVGLLLVFVLPGYTVAKATFPEWRVRGREAGERAVGLASLSLVLSVAITVLLGFALSVLPGGGFAATWSDPVLEAGLALVTVAGLGVGLVRGAYARDPPTVAAPEPLPGSDDGWGLVERLEGIDRERRRIRHRARTASLPPDARDRDTAALAALDDEAERIRARREAEYAQ